MKEAKAKKQLTWKSSSPLIVFACVLIVGLLTIFGPKVDTSNDTLLVNTNAVVKEAILDQRMEGIHIFPKEIYHVYNGNQEIGKLTNDNLLKSFLERIYKERYQAEFPDSKLSLGEDIHISKEMSFFQYENIDEKILSYLDKEDLFSVEVTKISFSNGATAYVKNLDDFTAAKDKYVLNFIDQQSLSNIQNKTLAGELNNPGETRDLSITIQESMETSKGFASLSKILKNVDEVLYFLSYGYDTEFKYYKVQTYDTVEGIARQYGLEPQHIVMINSQFIKSIDQFLEVGMDVNVTYYNSPITISVVRENLRREPKYPPATKTISDKTLNEGQRQTITKERDGYSYDLYRETWVNGVLQLDSTQKISSTTIVEPIQEVIRVGTKVVPGVGTGNFRYPIDNPSITCRWWCYKGHYAVDLQNRYNRYGNVYASDRGTVIVNTYHPINGNYMKINHGNGFVSFYGHMKYRSPINVGAKVEKGQVIGTIGMTGKASGPHVHFAIEKNGTRVNPCIYLRC